MRRMKWVLLLVGLLSGGMAVAQVRTAGDIDAKAFVIGLDAYSYRNGPLEFTSSGRGFRAEATGSTVAVSGAALAYETDDLLVGIHDFTGDNEPELVVGEKLPAGVKIHVLVLRSGAWQEAGAWSIPGGTECRIFRQALTIKDPATGVLHSWTWHGDRFDYKSSDSGASF